MKEFGLISRYFQQVAYERTDTLVGIGDDGAVTRVPAGQVLVTTTDTMVAGRHFLAATPADALAHKAIAVNLSDLAAMGAQPAWLNLSLSIPSFDEHWLQQFSTAFHELTKFYQVQLIGGDTVQGPLAITITAQGFVPEDAFLTRKTAKSGDWILVTGELGSAGGGLMKLQQGSGFDTSCHLIARHLYPEPQVLAGTCARRLASSAIDISDGLLQDLQHILNASSVGAHLDLDKLPIRPELIEWFGDEKKARLFSLTSGDDYQLLMTVSEEQRTQLESHLKSYDIPFVVIGKCTGALGKIDSVLNGKKFALNDLPSFGYQHFAD